MTTLMVALLIGNVISGAFNLSRPRRSNRLVGALNLIVATGIAVELASRWWF